MPLRLVEGERHIPHAETKKIIFMLLVAVDNDTNVLVHDRSVFRFHNWLNILLHKYLFKFNKNLMRIYFITLIFLISIAAGVRVARCLEEESLCQHPYCTRKA